LPRENAVAVLLHCELDAARRELPSWLGVLSPLAGGVLLQSQADDLGWMARELARLPFGFTIQSPPALAEALAAHARGLLAGVALG
jgi:predicted DNA-binding transcriptional regulator YafY